MLYVICRILIFLQLENGLDLAREMIKCYNEGKKGVTDENVGEDGITDFLLFLIVTV